MAIATGLDLGEVRARQQAMWARGDHAEIATLTSLVDAGALEGDEKDKPAPISFRQGWNIRPDLVFELPKPLKIPAKGTVEYTYIAVSAPFKEDTWIAAGEIRPSDRARSRRSGDELAQSLSES